LKESMNAIRSRLFPHTPLLRFRATALCYPPDCAVLSPSMMFLPSYSGVLILSVSS
jgi:hypothetical protein